MDVGRSVREALREQRKNNKWLAKQLNVSISMSYHHTQQKKQSRASIEKLAEAFDMTVQDFITLGEWGK